MKKQMTGSLYNRMAEGQQTGEPFVGMGATEMMYSDRHAYTVQKVISPKRVIVTRDKATRIDDNGASDCQEYEYESTPLHEEMVTGCTHEARLMFTDFTLVCNRYQEHGTCEGCELRKQHKKTNGIELRKCKGGWKRVKSDTYFALGTREEYYDFSF